MGGRIVTHIVHLALMGHLDNHSDKGRMVLLVMASIGRDKPGKNVEAGIYFGGWELLARSMGYKEYTPAAHRAVARCIAELTEAGLIEPLTDARSGHRQVYRITLPEVFPDIESPDIPPV